MVVWVANRYQHLRFPEQPLWIWPPSAVRPIIMESLRKHRTIEREVVQIPADGPRRLTSLYGTRVVLADSQSDLTTGCTFDVPLAVENFSQEPWTNGPDGPGEIGGHLRHR